MTDAAAAFDAVAARYDDDSTHAVIAAALVDGVAAGGPVATVLDVATGTGVAAFAALDRLHPVRVVAVDASAGMIGQALDKARTLDPQGRIHWVVGPAVPAPVPAAGMDVVLCASSLHFLGTAALGDWRRVLVPGGRVAFSLPSAATFAPSPVFAPLVAGDLSLPRDEDEAADVATRAGFAVVTAGRLVVPGERRRVAFVVSARAPGP
jgi:arsenite methyltransferase